MRDEFNHSPEGQDFSEYSMPFEESRPVDFTTPKEYVGVEELAKTREFSEKNIASALEDDNNHKKQKRKSTSGRTRSKLLQGGQIIDDKAGKNRCNES